jgi:hydroxylamine dehydrogenase
MVRSVALCFAVLSVALALLLCGPAGAATYTPQECITCHGTGTPGIVLQYQAGVMSRSGVTCVSCHGNDHAVISASAGKVPASTCAQQGCHPTQYAEFAHKDATGAFTNKHAIGWTKMTAAARYQVMPDAERYAMCERCHSIGYVYADGSVGKCDSCHTRHTFSRQEALEPEACGTCHMGPDHEQIDMWEKSKHGVVYTTERNRSNGNPDRAPACVTCHMPGQEKPAGQPLIHDVSTNITIGTVAQGARLAGTPQPVPMRTITAAEVAARRAKMTSICGQCHASGFVQKNLDDADQIKVDVDTLLWDPVMRIRGLWYDGLLDPMPVDRAANPVFGLQLVLGGQQLYGGTSAVEQLFFNTYKYDHVSTFKGAYHFNPDYSHWYGWARVNVDRDLIKGEEARLRRLEHPYDAGFTAARLVAGKAARFDASRLLSWGDASPNTFSWYFGDGSSEGTVTAAPGVATVTHVYAAPGTYKVRLTCSDTDLVNDSANPLLCSALRTTTLKVKVAKK